MPELSRFYGIVIEMKILAFIRIECLILHLSFALEPLHPLFVSSERFGKNLNGHLTRRAAPLLMSF